MNTATATRTATGYSIVFPDGTTEDVKTKVAYTHAVVIFTPAYLVAERRMSTGPVWHIASAHKNEAAAQRKSFFGADEQATKTIVAITD